MNEMLLRCGSVPRSCRYGLGSLVILLGLGLSAPPAGAVPVFFQGTDGFGITEAAALDAEDSAGVPIINVSVLEDKTGILDLILQDLDESSVTPMPPTAASNNRGTSNWQVQNVSGTDLIGRNYLLFVTAERLEVGGTPVEYNDANVGLDIDGSSGWVIIKTEVPSMGSFYYPAMSLGSLGVDAVAPAFLVNYVVNEPLQRNFDNDFEFPQLMLGYAFVPEPSVALLLSGGLIGLAFLGRRRS